VERESDFPILNVLNISKPNTEFGGANKAVVVPPFITEVKRGYFFIHSLDNPILREVISKLQYATLIQH